ncbi:Ig-like domain-containing protein [Reichenbachiella ulvae]|uniref:Ig-like domain-containing protein n=1 Tax=Reichenbachiella ulvae TaxID=2980104 RepID=A0ABT3CS35_9BACT|nr:Ig-like domain-containing protein [Reichenbachiella ulvae]MCV9386493.1 Ig-like domain-containing protein [Reichenbachiella ulvae]
MKINLLLITTLLLLSFASFGQTVTVNDTGLETYLLGLVDTSNGGNSDGAIQATEAEAFTGTIMYQNSGLTDPTGLEAFVNITQLRLYGNSLETIDLSPFTKVELINLGDNNLPTVDLSYNTQLLEIFLELNPLTDIDFSNNTLLEDFNVSDTDLTSLDVSDLTNLLSFSQENITGITEIDLSQNAKLDYVWVSNLGISSLDLSANPLLTEVNVVDNVSLTKLNIANGANDILDYLDIRGNATALTCVTVDDVTAASNNVNWLKDAGTSYSLDCAPPKPISQSPARNAVDVAVDEVFTVTYDETISVGAGAIIAVVAIDGTASFFMTESQTDEVTITSNTVTFDFANDLSYSTNYRITMSNIEDANGNKENLVVWEFTTEEEPDSTPPTIVSFDPIDNSTGVAIDADLVVTFDEPIQAGDGYVRVRLKVNTSSTVLAGRPQYETDQFTIDGNNLTIHLANYTNFAPAYDIEYFVTIENRAVSDLAGNDFAGFTDTETWTFTTESAPDVSAPTISSFNPLDNATDVARDADLVVTFDEPVQASDGLVYVKRKATNVVVMAGQPSVNTDQFSVSGSTLTIHLANYNLNQAQYEEELYVTIGQGAVEDLNSNDFVGFEDTETWTFTIEAEPDLVAPTVQTLSPLNNATDVALDANIVLTFSEDIAAVGSTNDIYLMDYAAGSVVEAFDPMDSGNGKITLSGNTLTINPTNDLEYEKHYYVVVDGYTLKDVSDEHNLFAGINAGEGYKDQWNFTTVAPDPEVYVTGLSPVPNSTGVALDGDLVITFNEPVFFETTGHGSVRTNQALHGFSIHDETYVELSGNQITIHLSALSLDALTSYYVQFDTDVIKDADGNYYAESSIMLDGQTYYFTTGEATVPDVIDYSPAIAATSVAVDDSYYFEFDVEVNTSASASLVIKNYATDEVVETIDISNQSAIYDVNFDPINDFPYETKLYIIVEPAGAISAVAGGEAYVGLDDKDDWSFTTEAAPILPVIESQSPADNAVDVAVDANLTLTFDVDVFVSGEVTLDIMDYDAESLVESIVLPEGYDADGSFSVNPTTDWAKAKHYYVLLGGTGYIGNYTGGGVFSGLDSKEDWDFTTIKIDQTITFDALSDKTYGDAAFDLSATASSGLTVAFSVVSGPASLDGNTLSITGVGEVVIAADQAGNESYNAASQVTQSFTVSKASQTITFDALSDMTYGDAAFDLSASASSGLTVSFSVVSGPVSLDGNALSITGVGEVVIAADQSGSDLYHAASQVTQSFTISKAEQIISIEAIADKVSTDADFEVVASTDSGLELTYEISGPATLNGTTVSLTGVSGIVTITVSQAGNEFYAIASNTVEFNVSEPTKGAQTITFDALSDKTYGDAAFELSATASSGLTVTFSVVSGPASLDGNTLAITGVGEVVIAANQAGDEIFNPATQVTQSFTILKADQNITFSSLADKTYGDAAFDLSASASSGLAVTFSIISGPVTLDGSTVTLTGAGEVVVAADQSGNDLYNAASQVTQSITVSKASQTITFDALSDKTFGDAAFDLSASASSGLTVSFSVVSGPVGLDGNTLAITGVGEVVIAADQAGDDLYSAASQVTQSFTISKAEQIITIDAIADKVSTDADFSVVASTDSGLELTYEVSGPATLAGTTVSLTGESGIVTITVSQAGDEFVAAASHSVSFSVSDVSKSAQTITFAEISDMTFGDPSFDLTATASSGLEVSYAVLEGPITISGSTVTINGAGTASISAQQSGNEAFNPAPVVTRNFVIAKAAQEITFAALSDRVYGDAPFVLDASASSGLAVNYGVVSGPATLNGNELSITGAGEVVVSANQIGNSNYLAAQEVTQSFLVAKKDQVITITAIEDKLVTDASFDIEATVDSGLDLVYEVSGPAALTGTTIQLTGESGQVTLTVSQAGNSDYHEASAQLSFNVSDPAKSDQTISFDAVGSLSFGDADVQLSATASSGLEVVYSVISGPVAIDGNIMSILGAGEAVIAADQAGDNNFNAATQVQQTFTINKAEQTIILESISDKLTTDDPFMVSATVDTGLPLSYVVSGPATVSAEGLITLNGATGVVQVEVTQDGNDNYLAASVQVSFAVTDPAKTDQTITFDALPDLTFGDAPVVLVATASSGLNITFKVVSGPVSIEGNALTVLGAGEAVIAANQAGDESFNAAPEVTQTFTIAKANQNIQVTAIEDKLAIDGPFDVEATVDSGLELSFAITGPATMSGQTITLDGTIGTVEIVVSQAGNENYEAASVTTSFEVTQVTAAELTINLEAYPNPTDGLLQIKSGSEIRSIEVYDLQGALRFNQLTDSKELKIDLRHLAQGSYVLRVFTEGRFENRRLLIH